MKIVKNNDGVVLIISYFVLVVLLGLSAVIFMRSINESRLAQRSNASLQAFYEAEAGIAFAYAEASNQGFEWYTHQDTNIPVTVNISITDNANTTIDFSPIVPTVAVGYINANNFYSVNDAQGNPRFQLKTYPERDSILNNFTGIVVIHSQATVNNVTRTIEYRLGQESAYQYFFFFPKSTDFWTATYDGRNYGGIHVNGNIRFGGAPTFKFLTELSCGWDPTVGCWWNASIDSQDLGYIQRIRHHKFADLHDNIDYSSTVSDPTKLATYMWLYSTEQYYTGNTYFYTGDLASPDPLITLPYYLSGTGAAYDTDRYDGDGTNTTPMHYQISNNDLENLGIYELAKGAGSLSLFSSQEVDISALQIGQGTEQEIFKKIYDYIEQSPGEKIGFWTQYWTQWKANHANDYLSYHTDGTLTGGEDWQRRFYLAAYDNTYDSWGDWNKGNPGTPFRVNTEWWKDLSYGDDRAGLTNDQAPAQVEDGYTGEKLDLYYLDTQEQSQAWETWLSNPNNDGTARLDQVGENQTLVQDLTQGGAYLDPGSIFNEGEYASYETLKAKAQNGGIYIGPDAEGVILAGDCNGDGKVNILDLGILGESWGKKEAWYGQAPSGEQTLLGDLNRDGIVNINDLGILGENWGKVAFANPIQDCTVETRFYNAAHPANYYSSSWQYRPSNVLAIDVHKLKQKIENEMPNFNGVVYVDLDGYAWSKTNHDNNAVGVMLTNGEILPEAGLSLVTPNNVYIKGNYNLDPDGVDQDNDGIKEREPDASSALNQVIGEAHYSRKGGAAYYLNLTENDPNCLRWHPAEVITKRAVYTLSEDFNEPMYMPMAFNHDQQYNEEEKRVSSQDFVNALNYPTDYWVPDPASTKSAKSRVNQWFEYYAGGQTLPSQWTQEWVNAHWPSNTTFSLDTNNNGEPDTYILSDDLRQDVFNHIEDTYDTTFSYSTIYPSGSPLGATTPCQYQEVNEPHIYNTAIVTPYSTTPYALEYWGSTDRTINGAFIQLPGGPMPGNYPIDSTYASRIPYTIPYGRSDDPDNFFNYETRFGKNANAGDKPSAGLLFGADSSWREIDNANF